MINALKFMLGLLIVVTVQTFSSRNCYAQFRTDQHGPSITLSSVRATCHRQAYHLWLVRKCLQILQWNVNHLINESITQGTAQGRLLNTDLLIYGFNVNLV